jgi:hypothetical protein
VSSCWGRYSANRWTASEYPGTLNDVEDKPGKYWDYTECRWVKCPTPAEEALVPEQADPAESRMTVEVSAEHDVRSG